MLSIVTVINTAYLYLTSSSTSFQTYLTIPFTALGNLFLIYLLYKDYELRGLTLWLALMILSIPTSFTNIFGGNYGSLPLSWYNIFFLVSFISWFLSSRRLSKNRTTVAVLLFLWLCAAVLRSYSPSNALRDFINFVPLIFFYSISTGEISSKEIDTLKNTYVIAGLSLIFPLLIQIASFFLVGKSLGKVAIYPNRIAFGTIFTDFSFLSLFFTSAAALIFEERLFLSVLLLLSSLLTSARTGFISFLLALVFIRSIILVKKQRIVRMIALCMFVIGFYYLGVKFLTPFRQEDLLDPTGRLASIEESVDLILDNLIMGVGLGTEDFKKSFGFSIPHNLIIQLILQTGLVGLLLFLYILIDMEVKMWRSINRLSKFFLTFNTIMIGSLFIPDIVNSRFLPVVIFMSLQGCETRHRT